MAGGSHYSCFVDISNTVVLTRVLKLLELAPTENDDWGEDIQTDKNLYLETEIKGDNFTEGRGRRVEALQRSLASARVASARSRWGEAELRVVSLSLARQARISSAEITYTRSRGATEDDGAAWSGLLAEVGAGAAQECQGGEE